MYVIVRTMRVDLLVCLTARVGVWAHLRARKWALACACEKLYHGHFFLKVLS
jgi:hypothetical protein